MNVDQPFSEQLWGLATTNYFQSIVKRTPAALQDIVGLARAVLQEDGDGDSSGDDSVEGEVDARALMCKSLIALICHTDALTGFYWFQATTPSLLALKVANLLYDIVFCCSL